jgi:RNA polymerase sigma-70 factor, ECF subfamily
MTKLPPDAVGDDDLLARIAAGDAAAFTTLFRRRQGEVFRFALHMIGSAAAAEDVAQDVFLTLMRDAGRYEPGRSSAPAWLCGIARNHALRRLERERSIVPLEEDAGPDVEALAVHPDPLGDLTRSEQVEALRRAILSLPVRYREVVVLCDLQELSYLDAAQAVGCAVGTIRSRLHRGRALLAAKLRAPGRAGRKPETVSVDAGSGGTSPGRAGSDATGENRVAMAGKPGVRCFA